MQTAQDGNVPGGLLKPDLSAAVDACDDWVEAQMATFNAALPQPYRAASSLDQRIALLKLVLDRRQQRFLDRLKTPAP